MSVRLGAGLLLAALCLVYLPSVGHGFVKDDVVWVAHSGAADARQFLLGAPTGFYRPMVSLSFAANRAACGTQLPRCYGIANFLLLLACAGAVFLLGRALALPDGAAVLAAGLWAFNWNGINMAALWISGRTALLLVLFATAAAAAFVRGRPWLAAMLMFGAMLSKEEAVLLPFALLAWWLIDMRLTRTVPPRPALRFAAASLVVSGVYLYLRLHSGALTPATAPSYYQLSFSAARVMANAPSYLDRAATFSAAMALLFVLVFRPRPPLMTAARVSQFAFGACWFCAGLGVTVFLPVRSSLYACLPSVGVALAAAAALEGAWRTLGPSAQRRAAVAGIAMTFALMPLYYARNRPSVREAELASRTMAALRQVAAERGAGTVVILNDDRRQRPSLDSAFGTLVQPAADLLVQPHVVVWIEPPPVDAALAGLEAPGRADVRLVLRDGALAPAN